MFRRLLRIAAITVWTLGSLVAWFIIAYQTSGFPIDLANAFQLSINSTDILLRMHQGLTWIGLVSIPAVFLKLGKDGRLPGTRRIVSSRNSST